MKPKEFIQQVFIRELEPISRNNPYIAFALMAIGIEFLGKCIDTTASHWNVSGRSKRNFESAIKQLNSLSEYREYLEDFSIWDSLRNGFAHSFVPKPTLSLSSKDEMGHLVKHNLGNRLNLKCEELFQDFRNACKEVIEMDFPDPENKMNKPFLSVPGE